QERADIKEVEQPVPCEIRNWIFAYKRAQERADIEEVELAVACEIGEAHWRSVINHKRYRVPGPVGLDDSQIRRGAVCRVDGVEMTRDLDKLIGRDFVESLDQRVERAVGCEIQTGLKLWIKPNPKDGARSDDRVCFEINVHEFE